jgi:hypothetical protein
MTLPIRLLLGRAVVQSGDPMERRKLIAGRTVSRYHQMIQSKNTGSSIASSLGKTAKVADA